MRLANYNDTGHEMMLSRALKVINYGGGAYLFKQECPPPNSSRPVLYYSLIRRYDRWVRCLWHRKDLQLGIQGASDQFMNQHLLVKIRQLSVPILARPKTLAPLMGPALDWLKLAP